ncbi:MAG TPA: YebC/PmpR family DNA-binding transcriptional regulator [bacterium]|nr:YebC/PmpR family DNA-binding transcriptional regulator [bacterium]
MSGHNKWSTIKRKKGAADQKRGREFSKIIKVITLAARQGGGDPDQNATLRTAVDKAKAINMPADNIQRAIKKGTGELEGANYEEYVYEGYGPGGIAIIIETLSDNGNRTTAEVRHALNKYGGSMGASGCVQWMFDKKGIIMIPAEGLEEEQVMDAAIEAGADDVENQGDYFQVSTEPTELYNVKNALAEAGFNIESAELSMEPQTLVDVSSKADSVLRLLSVLEDLDDVQNIYSNFDISEEAMEKFNG